MAAQLSGIIAILCAGAGDIGPKMSARAKAAGIPVNVMDYGLRRQIFPQDFLGNQDLLRNISIATCPRVPRH